MISCSKDAGLGGTSSISGTVTKKNVTIPSREVTEIICQNAVWDPGSNYFLLNTPAGQTDYYMWFTLGGAGVNPNLTGRTAILVDVDPLDDNTIVASKVKTGIVTGAGIDFSVVQSNDVLTITNVDLGYVVDFDDWSTPFSYDVKEQGESYTEGNEEAAVDERVYIIYGSDVIYGDDFRTDFNGNYRFAGLAKGSYIIYCHTKDPDTGEIMDERIGVTINSGGNEIVAEDINILW